MLNNTKNKNFYTMSFAQDNRLYKWICVVSMLAIMQVNGFSQCDYALACNDMVQISLGSDCTETITADMIIENPEFSDDNYLVVIELPDGTELSDPIVTLDHIGMTLEVKVTLTFNNCNISCWGNITVEDKLPPIVICPEDMTVDCGISLDPADIGGINPLDVTDCSGVDTIYFIDESEIMLCEDVYSEILSRTWHLVDGYGNDRICEQLFFIRAADIENVIMPSDFIVDCENLLVPVKDLTPDVTGEPTMIECANVQSYYTDLDFPLCGSGFKKRREWHVLDWCTGRDTVGYQTIKVEDTAPPTVTCGLQFYEIPSNVNACYATYSVPLPVPPGIIATDPLRPIISSDCSEVSFKIFYATFPPELDCNSLEDAQAILEATGESLEFIEVLPNFLGEYIIQELPNGCNWIKYVFEDACGHSTFCTKDIYVYDNAPPAAICEGFTVVTIDDNGWAHMLASSLDDHSWDYCDRELTFTARRKNSECSDLPDANPDDEDFDEFIHFCCQDVGSHVSVELMVMDPDGNYNFCSVVVYVDDKDPPVVSCPGNVELDCSQDFRDLNLTGEPSFTDNCHASIHQTYREFLNDCGIGYVLIDHAVWDNADNQIVCTQRVDVVNKDILTYDDVDWPMDIGAFMCDPTVLDPEFSGSKPTYDNYVSACSDIGVSMSDLTFYDVEGACLKIVRSWTVVDWCVSPIEYITHVQKILIFNTDAPEFTNCDDYDALPNDNCEGEVDIVMEVYDDCTAVEDLNISWNVDFDSDGSINDSGTGTTINKFYPPGKHTVTFKATDECDNEGQCSFELVIENYSEAPTPVCLNEVVWVLDETGQATIWASDFNFKSFDGCNGEDGIEFFFDDSFSQGAKSKDFDCTDLEPSGDEEHIPLKMYVRDQDGNFDYCDVTLILQDNNANACDDANSMGRLEGTVYDMHMNGIENVMVSLEEMSQNVMTEQTTGLEGLFAFDELFYFGEYNVAPDKYGDYLEGVSTLDLVLMQKHILGIADLDSPYKMIAADVNRSGSISAVDLIEIRKLILGIYDSFPSHDSWEFVSMTSGPLNMSNPWAYQDFQHFGALYENTAGINFVGVKIGDVNGSYSELNNEIDVESRSTNSLDLAQSVKGNSIMIEQVSDQLLNGYQFAMVIPKGMIIDQISNPNTKSFDESSWFVDGNLLKVSHYNVVEDQTINLKIDVASFGEQTELKLVGTIAGEAYNKSDEKVSIRFDIHVNGNQFDISANYPNPFSSVTNIDINIPDGKAQLIITDITGKVVLSRVVNQNIDRITLSDSDLGGDAGIYFYTLKNNNQSLTKKCILIK